MRKTITAGKAGDAVLRNAGSRFFGKAGFARGRGFSEGHGLELPAETRLVLGEEAE
ncbi:MAG: hypothetical protein JNN24_10125 [Hyphomicrobium zavarzinii]|jgi:hypothetical protein|uniref:hypothetical protein n=1 Tax=Hyphomicrobium TaxID=81 RepID=UPI0012EC8FBA|nr:MULTISPECIES: hypothetical protein [Hyphomicrobium]MBL8846113.1 hypothetical protein [Hyphomicrobium zavarzinii]WBT37585.1 hypothetical protein PE058_18260 [Hyphomicrobium sp. DMF-1]HML42084.1 hypothetical protein [Hyphomicrobium zavarzinii]